MRMFRSGDKPKKRSPIRNEPRRLPGTSLRARFDDVLMIRVLRGVVILVGMPIGAAAEWVRYGMGWNPTVQSSIGMTLAAISGVCLAAYKIWRMLPEARAITLGIEGEVAVGQFLQDYCRNSGYRVLHDIPGRGFNVDHVLVGPGGVFVIETKTISKPTKGNPTVRYDGQRILVDGFAPDRDPIAQVKAYADYIRHLLASSTGLDPRSFLFSPCWSMQDGGLTVDQAEKLFGS
jgi:hypothetical protein